MPESESREKRADRAMRILDILEETHPEARTYLDFDDAYQLLIATILSAQCTDERVNGLTPVLFKKYPDASSMAEARPEELQEMIRSTGFYRQKTKSVLACCQALVQQYDGEVPNDLEALTQIHGVGRKTASVVLIGAFGRQAIAVDTHVGRVSGRLGLAKGKNPDKIEAQLRELLPRQRWARATQLLGAHGRKICMSRKPDCERCPVNSLCHYYASL